MVENASEAASAGPRSGPAGPLAIIAGRGDLPRRLAGARRAAGLSSVIVVFPGFDAEWMSEYPVQHHEFERPGRLFRALRAAGVAHITFAGAMDRPRLRIWRADPTACGMMLRAFRLLGKGDDAMLRGFGAMLEARGFALVGAQEILGEELSARPGPLGARGPDAAALADAAQAARIVAALGPLDLGQGAVVAGGLCLGIETLGGTDHMLAGVAQLPAHRRQSLPKGAGVLFKAAKPDQDRRMDLPVIGPETVEAVARAGLAGIVVTAGEALVLDPDGTRAAADRLRLFVYGARADELSDAPAGNAPK